MKQLFESREAANLAGVPERRLRYWATSKVFSAAKDAVGKPGVRREYSVENLVEAVILREFEKHGVPSTLASKALDVFRMKKPDVLAPGLCILRIIGGTRIDVITHLDLLEEAETDEEVSKALSKYSMLAVQDAARDRLVELSSDPPSLGKMARTLQLTKDLSQDISLQKKLLAAYELVLSRKLARRLLEETEATLIVPVHKIVAQLKAKLEESA